MKSKFIRKIKEINIVLILFIIPTTLFFVCSDWPTIPQLYVKGEFVGGFDIVKTMFADGSLRDVLKDDKKE
jgi:glutaredoxin-related protein